MKKFRAKVIGIGTAVLLVLTTGLAHADSGSSPASTTVGQPITFVVESPQGLGRITYTNPRTHSTINVANNSAFTIVEANGLHYLTYTPPLGDVNRDETFSYTYSVDATGHLVRPVLAYVAYFHVYPAAVPNV